MSIDAIREGLQQGLAGGMECSLIFRADGDFSSTLTLGQIIKGKVMRHYEGSRYGISFNGQEKVVDSTFPMRNGDVIYAKVIGLDERVHLQRVTGDHYRLGAGETAKDQKTPYHGIHEYSDPIRGLFDQYRAKLSAEELRLIQQLQNTLGGSRKVALSALILSKIGVTLDSGVIRALHRILADLTNNTASVPNSQAAYALPGTVGAQMEEVVEGLAALLCSISKKGPGEDQETSAVRTRSQLKADRPTPQTFLPDSRFGQDRDKDHLEWFLGQWLLNTQTGGAVSHRFMRIPFWFGRQLVEVTLALFSQKVMSEKEHHQKQEILRYRSIVFSLETEALGHLEIQAKLADHHVRIEIGADSSAAAEYLGSKMPFLTTAMAAYGWQVDDLCYGVKTKSGGPLEAVIEHFIAQDSLNRLM